MNLNINIAIDDVHPQRGWRILGDPIEAWLKSLNEEFGARFTLFIPSNYHHQWPISEHKEWILELNSIPYFSCECHGHFHMTKNFQNYGEAEFFELQSEREVNERFDLMISEWLAVDIIPTGFRPPGWLCSEKFNLKINSSSWFKYVAVHYQHNQGLKWTKKTFFGHDGINQTEIGIHNYDYSDPSNPIGMIMFQSHIAGDWNDNVWNQANYDQLRVSLEHLVKNNDCEFKTLKECV